MTNKNQIIVCGFRLWCENLMYTFKSIWNETIQIKKLTIIDQFACIKMFYFVIEL